MTAPAAKRTMTHRQRFRDTFEKESAITLKVLRAYPADKLALQPHERSSSAQKLAWTFVVEQQLLLKAIRGQELFGGGAHTPPDSWNATVDAYESGLRDVIAELSKSENPDLDGSVGFFTGPKQMGQIPLNEFVWFMLHDQIHHRGQLSVYLRLAGAKVPSIYGPSADEPWM